MPGAVTLTAQNADCSALPVERQPWNKHQHSGIANQLLTEIGRGERYVSTGQCVAKNIADDCEGACPVNVAAMATLGGENAHVRNMERDLHRWLKGAFALNLTPSLYIAIEINTNGKVETVDWPVLKPSELVAAIYEAGAVHFANSLSGDMSQDNHGLRAILLCRTQNP